MSITVKWDNDEETVLCYEIKGNWTLQEFDAAIEETYALCENYTGLPHIILDMRNTREVADGILVQLRKAMRLIPEFNGTVCVVTNSTEIRTGVKMFMRIFKPDIALYIVNSLKSARNKFPVVSAADERLEAELEAQADAA